MKKSVKIGLLVPIIFCSLFLKAQTHSLYENISFHLVDKIEWDWKKREKVLKTHEYILVIHNQSNDTLFIPNFTPYIERLGTSRLRHPSTLEWDLRTLDGADPACFIVSGCNVKTVPPKKKSVRKRWEEFNRSRTLTIYPNSVFTIPVDLRCRNFCYRKGDFYVWRLFDTRWSKEIPIYETVIYY